MVLTIIPICHVPRSRQHIKAPPNTLSSRKATHILLVTSWQIKKLLNVFQAQLPSMVAASHFKWNLWNTTYRFYYPSPAPLTRKGIDLLFYSWDIVLWPVPHHHHAKSLLKSGIHSLLPTFWPYQLRSSRGGKADGKETSGKGILVWWVYSPTRLGCSRETEIGIINLSISTDWDFSSCAWLQRDRASKKLCF